MVIRKKKVQKKIQKKSSGEQPSTPTPEFQKASEVGVCYQHEFEIGRLRTKLIAKVIPVELHGKPYYILADPLNDKYELSDKIPGA